MGNDACPSRKAKDDELSSSKKNTNGGKNDSSGSSSVGSSGLRRSTREIPSKQQNNSSPVSVRKSQRLENRTPPTTPLRRSERENKFHSPSARILEKGSTSSGGLKQLKGHNTRLDARSYRGKVKELAEEVKRKCSAKQGNQIGTKRKTRLDCRSYREMFKPLKKKIKVPDSAKKTMRVNHNDCGDSGSENDVEGQQEHDVGEELKEDCTTNIDHDAGFSNFDAEKHVHAEKPKPSESENVKCSQVSDTGNLSSSGTEAKKNKHEGMEADCTMMGKNKKIHNQEEHFTSLQMSDGDNASGCNLKGTTPGASAAVSEGAPTCTKHIVSSVSSVCNMSFLIEQCDKCSRKRRLDYNSPEQELCCCLSKSNSMNDVDMFSVTKDRGECGTCVTAQFAEKHCQDVQPSDPPLDDERSTCATCRHPGKLLCCGGKGCKRSYHPSCLLTPEVDIILRIWYCSQCTKRRLTLGVHSVSEGIESIWDVREVQLSNSEGVEKQKQYFVKYKGLAHIHNHWVPEMLLLHEVPELLAKFTEKEEGQWKPEWAVPHRLLLKRSLVIEDNPAKHNNEDTGIVSNGQCQWLVKWSGIDYDQATWESEDSSCFKASYVQRLINEYETRYDMARRKSLCRGNEIQERRKGSNVKLGRLSGGGLSGADSCYLNSVNKLRECLYKGHNAVLLDEQDRMLKVAYLVSSLLSYVNRPFIIIAPYASLCVWEAEFLRIDSSVNVVVYCGSTNARKVVRSLDFHEEGGSMMLQVLLSSVEVISEDLEELKGIGWEAVILDDCQQSYIWSHSVAIKNLVTDWRVLLVNAQLKDNVSEYNNILSLLEPGGSLNQNPGVRMDCSETINVLKERLSSFVVCPRFLEYWVPVQISNLQLEHYCSLLMSNSTALRSCSKSDPVGSLRDILISTRKCCDHPYIVNPSLQSSLANGYPREALLDLGIRASGKLLLLDEILTELKNQELKVLILFQSIGGSGRDTTGDILDDFLHYRFGSDSYEHVDGGGYVSSKKQAALNKFNRERGRSFFLLETRACLPSVKLSSVDAVVIFDSDWNPLNDLRALQRITIDSKLEQIKVFRLYCSCTVEEKVLVLAKNDMILDSTLQGFSPSTSHMLLMWGSSYLFSKLDEFHHEHVTDYRDNIVPEYSSLKDVCEEILSLFQNHETVNPTKFISLARQNGRSYLKNTGLIGEKKIQLEDGVPPHAFWTNLLEGKQPQWKYLSGSSQRNRKRVHYLDDSPTPSEVQADEATKKRKKMDGTKVDSSPRKVRGNLEKLNAANTDYQDDIRGAPDVMIESDNRINLINVLSKKINLINEQRELFQMLKPTTLILCEILLLKDDVKILAEQFLEYIVNNHRVTREPETILQAFKISVCWTAAAMLNQKIDHKKSLTIAREKMHFSCTEDEADFMYSKLKSLKKMFLLRSEVFRTPNSLNETHGTTRELKENGVEPEECLLVKPVQMTNNENDMLRHIKKVNKKCENLMERLKIKQNEEFQEFKKTWEDERAELEKMYRMESAVIRSIHNKSSVGVDKLNILDNTYARKRENLERQISIYHKELEARQQAERDGQLKKAARWLEQVKSLAQEELICHDGATLNSSEALPMPKEVGLGTCNLAVEGSLEQPLATLTTKMDKDTNQINSVEVDRSTTLETNRADATSTSLICSSTEPLSSLRVFVMEQPTMDPASMSPLPVSQGLEDESCCRLVDGAEERVQHIFEPVQLNLLCNGAGGLLGTESVITPHHDQHNRDASSGRLDNECSEVHTSSRGTITPIQQGGNITNTSVLAGSLPIPELAEDYAIDANLGQCETRTSTACDSHPNPLQMPTFTISQLPSLSSDPLQNELERIHRETDEITNIHEEMKLRLKSEREKEIEEIVAQIHKRYDEKLKEADASFSLKRNELQVNQDKVMMHKFLAMAFESKCSDTKEASGMQQVISSGLMEHFSQLPTPRPSSITASFSGSPSPDNAAPHVRAMPVANLTTRSSHVNPLAQTAGLQQVRSAATRAPGPHLQSSSAPIWPPQPFPNSQGETLGSTRPLNLTLSATELLVEIGRQNADLANNLPPPLPDNVCNSESWDISEFGAAVNLQLPSSTLGAGNDVVCLSDDD